MELTTSTDVLAMFTVPGRPKPKGSLQPIVSAGRYRGMREGVEGSSAWRTMVKQAAQRSNPHLRLRSHQPETGAVLLTVAFYFARPKSGQGLLLPWPTISDGINAVGDTDKLIRNVGDALKDAGVIKDDSLIVGISSTKQWCPAGVAPGAEIVVQRAPDWDMSVMERVAESVTARFCSYCGEGLEFGACPNGHTEWVA